MLTRANIRAACYETVYRRGVILHEQGRVRRLSYTMAYGNTEIEGDVMGSRLYHVTMKVTQEGDIGPYSCTCPYYDSYDGICKHAVAVALDFHDMLRKNMAREESKKSRENVQTDGALSNAMAMYARKRALPEVATEKPVQLECRFEDESAGLSLEMRIGRSRMYVVKNLLRLACSLEDGAEEQYGTAFVLRHTLSAFDGQSRAVAEALIESVRDRFPDYRNMFVGESSREYRSIILWGEPLHRILRLFLGKNIVLEQKETHVVDGDPSVVFRMKRISGGAEIIGPNVRIYDGRERCFVRCGDSLYYCTPKFTTHVLPLLQIFKNDRYGYWHNREKKLRLSEQDFTAFCGNVLPMLEGLAKVECDQFDLADFAPPEPVFSVYLHKAGGNSIGANAVVTYGKNELDLLSTAPRGGEWHDAREDDLLRVLREYFPETAAEKKNAALRLMPMNSDETEAQETVLNPGERETIYATGDEAVYALLCEGIDRLTQLAEVYGDSALRNMAVRPAPNVHIGVSLESGLLDIRLDVENFDIDEINGVLRSYRVRKKYHRLKNGDFVRLDDNALETLSELSEGLMLTPRQLAAGQAQVPASRALYVDSVLESAQGVSFERSRDFRRMIRRIRDIRNGEYLLPEGLCAQLRPYQADGYQWLCTLYDLSLGGILADDMGLGKTLQMIAMMLRAAQEKADFSALVIAPASLLYNWESETSRFAPALSVQIITGNATERAARIKDSASYHVNITSYDLLRRDTAQYEAQRFDCLVLDEAQAVKNAATKAAKSILTLNAAHRFAMTGTPVENRLSDLWSIMNCLMPGYLYAYETFCRELEQPIVRDEDEVAKKRLARMVAPFLLRRKKTDVLHDLPDKLEENIAVSMSEEQRKLYEASRDKLVYDLTHASDEEIRENRIRVLAALTRLRQLCCSPALCYENYAGGSGKVDACLELLHSAVSAGHRVLVFSQFTSMLELLISQWDGPSLYLSGKDSKLRRKEMVEQFQEGNIPVFFISLKAGGTGLNLTQADTVIHCDPWWNIAAQNQATDRAHRIGQKKTVNVLRLVAKDTIEEKILKLQEQKSALADTVLEGRGGDGYSLDRGELLMLFEERSRE